MEAEHVSQYYATSYYIYLYNSCLPIAFGRSLSKTNRLGQLSRAQTIFERYIYTVYWTSFSLGNKAEIMIVIVIQKSKFMGMLSG